MKNELIDILEILGGILLILFSSWMGFGYKGFIIISAIITGIVGFVLIFYGVKNFLKSMEKKK